MPDGLARDVLERPAPACVDCRDEPQRGIRQENGHAVGCLDTHPDPRQAGDERIALLTFTAGRSLDNPPPMNLL